MFSVGDKVVYPVHGAGIIEAIENKEILGQERSYYILRTCTGDMRLMIPVETVTDMGLRQIIAKSQVAEVLAVFEDCLDEIEDNWNRRYRINMEKIKSGNILQVAVVVRNLMLRDGQRGLSAGERKMLEYAQKVLFSELMLVEGSTEDHIISIIENILAGRDD